MAMRLLNRKTDYPTLAAVLADAGSLE